MKSVFFGPFIGEFGWELNFWSRWVNNVRERYFHDRFTLVASYPGRQVLYRSADKFLYHPQWWIDIPKVQRNYIIDYWVNGFPRDSAHDGYKQAPAEDMCVVANRLLEYYIKQLPYDTAIFCPFKLNYFPQQDLTFGVHFDRPITCNADVKPLPIPDFVQKPVRLSSTPLGRRALPQAIHGAKGKVVALFPRHRLLRAHFNWPEEQYRGLIVRLQEAGFDVALLGEPGGCYFANDIPRNCIDLINEDPLLRTDIHIACLELSSFALGVSSGSTDLALAVGCPTLTWGPPERQIHAYRINLLRTRHYYYPVLQCSVDELWRQVKAFYRGFSIKQRWSQARFQVLCDYVRLRRSLSYGIRQLRLHTTF